MLPQPSCLKFFTRYFILSVLLLSPSLFSLTACDGGKAPELSTETQTSRAPGKLLSERDKNEFVDTHNLARQRHGLPPLSWSEELSQYAQRWADRLQATRQCRMQHRPRQGRFKQAFGENLFWASPDYWSDGTYEVQHVSPAEVVKAWVDEIAFYDYATNSCKPNEQCGHYTQIVWRSTKRVGCAVSYCPDRSQVWVCNYDPPGNYVGEKPY